ncbi:hypothetical protein [Clostridium sp. ZBS18]|nr:hypothetical protein [Clostridium sp. ZBS18]
MIFLFEKSVENYQFFETFIFTITTAVLTLSQISDMFFYMI